MGVLIRVTGDIIAISPPLIINEAQITEIFSTIARALDTVA
jgi:beta-alanine--pyruvate transaminase